MLPLLNNGEMCQHLSIQPMRAPKGWKYIHSNRTVAGCLDQRSWTNVLRTVFTEVVTILNNCPLTPISDDLSDCKPLTPTYFLLQQRSFALPSGLFVSEDLYITGG